MLKSYKSAAWAHCNPVVVWSSQLVWGSSYTHLKLNIQYQESFHNDCDHLRASNQISHSIAIYRGGKLHACEQQSGVAVTAALTDFQLHIQIYSNLSLFFSIRIWNPIPISFITFSVIDGLKQFVVCLHFPLELSSMPLACWMMRISWILIGCQESDMELKLEMIVYTWAVIVSQPQKYICSHIMNWSAVPARAHTNSSLDFASFFGGVFDVYF